MVNFINLLFYKLLVGGIVIKKQNTKQIKNDLLKRLTTTTQFHQLPLVEVSNLNYSFGSSTVQKQVLFDINLKLEYGEIAILTGPSGSGKTTLLSLIGGLRGVQEGMVEIRGEDISKYSESRLVEIRKNIGFIFQTHNLFASLKAYENVFMAIELKNKNHKEKYNLACRYLEDFGLADRLDHKPAALSVGQRQRVAIARALVNEPKLILADEPTASLDRENADIIVKYLKNLCHEKKRSILIVTHDTRITKVADRIINLMDGRIVSNVSVRESVDKCQFLKCFPLFKDLPLQVVNKIADNLQIQNFAAGEHIIRKGEYGETFYIIRNGSVTVEVDDGVTLDAGDHFGEQAILSDAPRNANVTALEDVELYVLEKEYFQKALNLPSFQEQIETLLFQRS